MRLPLDRRPRPAKSPAVYYGHLAAQRSRHAQAVKVHRIQRIRVHISDSTAKILRLGIRVIGGVPSRIRPDPITGFWTIIHEVPRCREMRNTTPGAWPRSPLGAEVHGVLLLLPQHLYLALNPTLAFRKRIFPNYNT